MFFLLLGIFSLWRRVQTPTRIQEEDFMKQHIMFFFFIAIFAGCTANQQKSFDFVHIAPEDDLVGQSYSVTVGPKDTLPIIAQQNNVGMKALKDANPKINYSQLSVGQKIRIPKQYLLPPIDYRNGIVINVSEMRLYYFNPDGSSAMVFPVALGREKWRTPVGETTVIRKKKDPSWIVPQSIKDHALATTGTILPDTIPPGENNPLGHHALYLGMPGYLIHGTNDPSSIGQLVSSGCIRMFNKDIEKLFSIVNEGTSVHIIHFPDKVGWHENKLYIEAHQPLTDDKGLYEKHRVSTQQAIDLAIKGKKVTIDDAKIEAAISQRKGLPIGIGFLNHT